MSLIISVLVLSGCSKPGDSGDVWMDPCAPGPTPELEIGVGESGYEPLVEGDPVELVHGPQGGYHVILALAGRYLDASSVWTVTLSGTIDGALWGHTVPYADARCAPDGSRLEAWNLLLIWDDGILPEELDGKYAEVQADVVDAGGTEISATTALTIDDRSR